MTNGNDRRFVAIAVVVAAVVFVADLSLPFDLAVSAIYGLVVLLGLFIRDPRFPLRASVAVTILTLVGGWLSPPRRTAGARHREPRSSR